MVAGEPPQVGGEGIHTHKRVAVHGSRGFVHWTMWNWQASIDGQPARLIPKNGGQALLIKKQSEEPEQVTLQLEYAKGFVKAPGQNSVSFQAPLAPVNRW